ncbi:hypothetical protein THAOC_18322, partial [Thalassiosira oceanica]
TQYQSVVPGESRLVDSDKELVEGVDEDVAAVAAAADLDYCGYAGQMGGRPIGLLRCPTEDGDLNPCASTFLAVDTRYSGGDLNPCA